MDIVPCILPNSVNLLSNLILPLPSFIIHHEPSSTAVPNLFFAYVPLNREIEIGVPPRGF